MELSEIGVRLNIENRTLRYVVEQGIVPGLERVNQGRGNRRRLSKSQAQSVALAAMLHDSGLRGSLLQKALQSGRAALRSKETEFRVDLNPCNNRQFTAALIVSIGELVEAIV